MSVAEDGPGQAPRFTGPEEEPLRYRVDDMAAGRGGGEGIVYPALRRNGERVALKLLRDRDLDFPRMRAFAPALARLRHPNLVRQTDIFIGAALCPATAPRGEGGFPFDVLT